MAGFLVAQLALLGIISLNLQCCFGQVITQAIPTTVTYDTATAHTAIGTSNVARDSTYGYYKEIYIDGTTSIVVGEKNRVGVYTVSNLNLQAQTALPCKLDVDGCENYISTVNEYNNDWYYCGTNGEDPLCGKCDLRECTQVEINSRFKTGEKLISKDHLLDHQPLLFYNGAPDNRVFGGRRLVIRSDKIKSDGTFPEPENSNMKPETKEEWISISNEPIQYASDPIAFTNSGGENVIYYFFYETAREYTYIDQPFKRVYPRVARFCRDDDGAYFFAAGEGFFATFLKARLSCTVPERFSDGGYDYLRDVFQSKENSKLLYMVFSDNPINKQANSAVCVYHLDLIDYIFKNSKFSGQGRTFFTNAPHGPRAATYVWQPPPDAFENGPGSVRPGTCGITINPQDLDLQEFISDYVLLNSAIPSLQSYPTTVMLPSPYSDESQPPVMLLEGLYVTEMVVQEKVCGDPGQTVFFLGTVDGKVYKAYTYGIGTSSPETRIVEEIDLSTGGATGDDHEVLSMEILINPDNDASTFDSVVFVGTPSSLHKIPVQHCSDYTFERCILSQDPYCSWSVTASACTAACNGEKCPTSDPYTSCPDLSWPAAPEVNHPTADTCCPATYDRIAKATSVATEQTKFMIDMFVESTEAARWAETTIACTCGCPATEKEENTGIYTTAEANGEFKSYLLGTYVFDLSSCNADGTITFTFKTTGNTKAQAVTVTYDNGDLVTDTAENTATNNLDAKLYGYKYQVSWWNKYKGTNRNAESSNCSNCPTVA